MSKSQNTVVVLGTAVAGIPIIHRLARDLPANWKVVAVNPSTTFYWNFASPRGIVNRNAFSENNSNLFVDILSTLSSHAVSRFTFIQGKAVSLDASSNTITIERLSDSSPEKLGTETLPYTHLIVTTGSQSGDNLPFKPVGTTTETKTAIDKLATNIASADGIVVSGGGATAIEFTGEVASYYPSKSVTLVSTADRLLAQTPAHVGAVAKKQLESLGVKVRLNTRVSSVTSSAISLEDGYTIPAELHIPAFGVYPNTQFIPSGTPFLDSRGFIKVDSALRAEGMTNIWAAGDVINVKDHHAITAAETGLILVTNVLAVTAGSTDKKTYEEKPAPLLVPIGPKFGYGTGWLFGMKPWGWLVWLIKSRTFMVANAPDVGQGKKWVSRAKV